MAAIEVEKVGVEWRVEVEAGVKAAEGTAEPGLVEALWP